RILLIAKRDYLAAIRTKAFLFGLIFAPLMFGGGFLGLALMRGKVEVDRHIAVLDRTGKAAAAVIQAAEERNQRDMFDKLTGKQVMARYRFEAVAADDAHVDSQRLALSDRVRRRELVGFLEIGPGALQPAQATAPAIAYYANGIDDVPRWLGEAANQGLRRVRLQQIGVEPDKFDEVLGTVPLENRNLVSRDAKTGMISAPHKSDQAANFAVPYAMT